MTRNNEDIWEFPNISTKKQRAGWYVPETVQHPAKMPTYLVDKIIEEYTKPGDVILEPMGGCGTTGIEAIKKGRNCIMVDYERKFCDLMQKNIDVANKQQTLTPKGKATVIHGDARNMSSLLGEVDQIVFSPPYAIDPKNICHTRDGKSLQDYDEKRGYSKTHHGRTGYSDDPDNIGNLKYGKVDQVIFSPPFANLNKGGGIAVKGYEGEYGKDEKLKDRHARRLSEDPNNIDNIKKYGSVDSIVMSPPYKTATKGSGLYKHPERAPTLRGVCNRPDGLRTSTDPENIGNLKYGSVDSIMMSPPYSKDVVPHTSHRPGHTQDIRGYSDDKDNLGNLPYGKVDSVIMSPPYAELKKGISPEEAQEKALEFAEKGEKFHQGRWEGGKNFHTPGRLKAIEATLMAGYSQSPNNIGNLKYGKVDSVIMSPPYEGALESKRHVGGIIEREKTEHETTLKIGLGVKYSDDKNQIGNLKGQTYLEAMHQVYSECFNVLKRGGYMILVVKNFIRNKKIVDLAADTVKLCESVGFKHVRTHKRKLTQLLFWIINYRKKYPDAPKVDFEHVLVFQKV